MSRLQLHTFDVARQKLRTGPTPELTSFVGRQRELSDLARLPRVPDWSRWPGPAASAVAPGAALDARDDARSFDPRRCRPRAASRSPRRTTGLVDPRARRRPGCQHHAPCPRQRNCSEACGRAGDGCGVPGNASWPHTRAALAGEPSCASGRSISSANAIFDSRGGAEHRFSATAEAMEASDNGSKAAAIELASSRRPRLRVDITVDSLSGRSRRRGGADP
jgi:hypothetical protein